MKKPHNIFVLLLVFVFATSCIEDYDIPEGGMFESEIVIEGTIRPDGVSVVHVSNSEPLAGDDELSAPLSDAEVRVIADNGFVSEPARFVSPQGGNFFNPGSASNYEVSFEIDVRPIDPSAKYAVEVKVGGEVYRSDFEPVLFTPAITAITYDEEPEQLNINVEMETTDCKYFIWSYQEYWQYIYHWVERKPTSFDDPSQFELIEHDDWVMRANLPRRFMLYSLLNINPDRSTVRNILTFDPKTNRFVSLYSIEVTQRALTAKAYQYYQAMKANLESTGSLFPIMPTDVRGNLRCVSNPQKGVRGIVTASSVQTKQAFIYAHDLQTYKCKGTDRYEGYPTRPPYFWPPGQPPSGF